MPPPYTDRPPRSENYPPKLPNGISGHHPSRSQEDAKYRPYASRRPQGPQGPQGPQHDIFADPPDAGRSYRRPTRRNSDSSIASKHLSPEEEARRRHRKAREARHRDRENKGRPPPSRSGKSNRRIDLIDSLDVTSIHGIGSEWLTRQSPIPKFFKADFFSSVSS